MLRGSDLNQPPLPTERFQNVLGSSGKVLIYNISAILELIKLEPYWI